MKKSLFILLLLSIECLAAQSLPKVENHLSKAMDVVLFTFGMEKPIAIGTLSNSGELHIKLPEDLDYISAKAKKNSMVDAAFVLFSNCDNGHDILSEEENSAATGGGYISLSTKENPYAGLLFMVTNEDMVPWLDGNRKIDAVLGSYFELVYMDSDFNYQGDCKSTISHTENDTIVTNYIYDLKLKAGFNFIEYKIESVEKHDVPSQYEEDAFDKIDQPSRVVVTSSQSTLPDTKWIGKFF